MVVPLSKGAALPLAGGIVLALSLGGCSGDSDSNQPVTPSVVTETQVEREVVTSSVVVTSIRDEDDEDFSDYSSSRSRSSSDDDDSDDSSSRSSSQGSSSSGNSSGSGSSAYANRLSHFHAIAGNDVTSQPFANSVLETWVYLGEPIWQDFNVYSPTTGKYYTMSCVQGDPPPYPVQSYCSGGNNASVLISWQG